MEMIGQKIKELRVLKGLTQEDLADKTNLSIRTIQRIENGDVDPRTYTLNLLAEALDVDIELFTSEKIQGNTKTIYSIGSKRWLILLHLSGLFNFILPPVLIWIWKKEELKGYEKHYKDIMNFQLSVLLYILFSLMLVAVIIGIILLPLIGILSSVVVIMNTIKISNGQQYKYPLVIQFIKQ